MLHELRDSARDQHGVEFVRVFETAGNPIANYVRGSISRLRKSEPVTADILEAVDRVAAKALPAGEIIWRVRSFVRKAEPKKIPVEINATIREAIDLLRAEANNNGIVVVFSLEGALPRIFANKIQMQQVILNSIIEARGGRLGMTIDGEGGPPSSSPCRRPGGQGRTTLPAKPCTRPTGCPSR